MALRLVYLLTPALFVVVVTVVRIGVELLGPEEEELPDVAVERLGVLDDAESAEWNEEFLFAQWQREVDG